MKGRFQRLVQTGSMAIAIVAASALAAAALEVEIDKDKAATVKAAYLLNFLRYAQWPESAFETPEAPLVVTQVGDCDVGNVLPDLIARAEPIGGHPLALERVAAPEAAPDRAAFLSSIDKSHLIFVCPCSDGGERVIFDHLRGSRVLTVGDTADFADNGGMLGFVLQRDRIVFEANPRAFQESTVTMSAKVLKLARIVGEGD